MNNSYSSPKIVNCTFSSNTAPYGGGINNSSSSPKIVNCTFSSNTASTDGGGICNANSSPSLVNCSFSSNTAGGGGGIFNGNSSLSVVNCSFSLNTASYGGGIYHDGYSASLINCIFWGNNNQISGSPTVSYSIVQGGYTGTGNLNADPLFIDAAKGNLRLKPNSPAIDNGNNAANTTSVDLDGKTRIVDGTIDIGAYEFQCAPTILTGQPQNTSVCTGGTATFTVAVTGSGLTYKWYKDGQSARSSSNSSTLTISNVTAADSGSYKVDIISNCGTVTSGAGTLTVNPATQITTQLSNTSVCKGGTATFTIAATGTNLTYKWYKNGQLFGLSNNSNSITVANAQPSDTGSYTVQVIGDCGTVTSIAATLTVNSPVTPVVTVANNCGTSTLSTITTGTLLWSTGETTSSITVSDAGSYTVTQTINGCTSPAGSGTAAPNAIPSTPVVTVTNNCGSSTILTTATGNLLWSTGETTPSITVSNAGNYTVTQTVNGCTSDAASATATPNAIPPAPSVTIVNNCGSSTLSTNATGTLLWSTGATTPSITVTTAGDYGVTQTINGCISAASSGTAAPNAIPSTPVVTVTNNCGSSTLSTNASGSLIWSTGETSSSINVSNAGTYTVTQTVNGCTSDAGSGNASPKTAPSKPVVTANGSTDFCQGGSVTLSAPSGFASYKWSNNATTQTITVMQSGSYSVVVTNADGCSSPASDPIKVTAGNDTQKPAITCPAAVTLCYDAAESYTIASLQATDNCGIASISYQISGATTRSGSGADASGKFSSGTSTITWTVKDGSGNTSTCQSNVTVNDKFTVSIPDGWALGSGCTLNTVYIGYTPASYILLIAKPSGGKSPYTYKWSNGSTASFILVNPAATTTYTVTVKDAKGCTQSASKQIKVVDVQCGSKMDKVSICHKGNTLCISKDAVADHLLHGDYLGNCKGKTAASREENEMVEKEVKEESNLTVKASPNPSTSFFKLNIISNNVKDKVSISVVDEVGRSVETMTASAGQTLQVGDRYRAGVYFVQATQGNKRVTMKLIKQAW